MSDAEALKALIRAHYRWWTVRLFRDCVKLGPVSLTWYRWVDDRWRLEACLLCHRLFVVPSLTTKEGC